MILNVAINFCWNPKVSQALFSEDVNISGLHCDSNQFSCLMLWDDYLQSWVKYLEENREIQWNWRGQEVSLYIYICSLYSSYIYIFMSPSKFNIFVIFPYFLSLKSFGNSWGNSYTKFAILDITFRFTCG